MKSASYDTVKSLDDLERIWAKLASDAKPIGFDIETGYLGEDNDRGALKQETNLLVGFSFTNNLNWAKYVPLAHDFSENITDHVRVAEILWPVFQLKLIVAHNAGFELRRMSRFFREMLSDHPIYGKAVRDSKGYFPVRSCTQVEAYILRDTYEFPDPKDPSKNVTYREFALKPLVEGAYGHKMIHFEDLFEKLTESKKKAFRFNILDLNTQVITYACEDALWCLKLHLDNYDKVKNQEMYQVDMDITYVICDMEDFGIQYDWHFMAEASARAKEFTELLNDEIQTELARMTNSDETKLSVNLASPAQLSDILYNKLGLKVNIFVKGSKENKKMSTGKEALAALAEKYPIAKKISNYKNLKRLTGSFLDKYEKDYGNSPDGRIHPSLNQSYVRTARFSSSNPNQQNQPAVNLKDKETGKPLSYDLELNSGATFKLNFRDSVIAPEDYLIVGFDLSQAEYRAVAGLANETAMIEAFESGTDIHEFVARMMFKIPEGEKVPKHLRSRAKTLGFGLLFGMTAQALAKKLNCSKEEAEDLFRQYFKAFPRLKRYTEKQIEFATENGYVTTKFGRVIPIWELGDSKPYIREGGMRASYNYPVQGGATGDYVRKGMVNSHKVIKEKGWQDKVILFMNVHDALEFYVHKSLNIADVIAALQPEVIFPVAGWPMMKADWHVGKRWGSVKEIKVNEDGSIVVEGSVTIHRSPPEELHTYLHLESKDEQVVEEPTKVETSTPTPGTTYLPTLQINLLITVKEMPTKTKLLNLKKLIAEYPGNNSVQLAIPGGLVNLPDCGLIAEQHAGVVSRVLGECEITEKISEVDIDLSELGSEIQF